MPPNYQNAPPESTNPPATRSETPSGGATGQGAPEPSTGVEGGNAGAREQMSPTDTSTTTMPDTPPTTTT